jgi:tRNA modification GTPase
MVRMTGGRALKILAAIFKPRTKKKIDVLPSYTLHAGIIHDRRRTIDQAMVSLMRGPGSYTGEDLVEISLHGSPVILKQVLQALYAYGVRLAEPGEFTRRAFLNGKMDLTQAEAVADLIRAKTDTAAQAAQRQLEGGLSRDIERMRQNVVAVLARIEARLDYPEEDIASAACQSIKKVCGYLIKHITALLDTVPYSSILRDGARIAIIGKPNVGKSSLLNALIKEERAIVTQEPGTTRDTIEAAFVVRGIPATIIDTAGIRQRAQSEAERLGIQRSIAAADHADVVIAVLDGSAPLTAEDKRVLGAIVDKRAIIAVNKIDLRQTLSYTHLAKIIPRREIAKISAATGQGIDTLKAKIYRLIEKHFLTRDHPRVMINTRHEQALCAAKAALERCMRAAAKHEPDECVAIELRETLNALDEITGSTATEDILNKIFSTFCVGK